MHIHAHVNLGYMWIRQTDTGGARESGGGGPVLRTDELALGSQRPCEEGGESKGRGCGARWGNLTCSEKKPSGCFLTISNKTVVDKTPSFGDAHKGNTALPSPQIGLLLSRSKCLNRGSLFPRECLAVVCGNSECLGSILFSRIQPFNIYCLFKSILRTLF